MSSSETKPTTEPTTVPSAPSNEAAAAQPQPENLEALRREFQIPIDKVARKFRRKRATSLIVFMLVLAGAVAAVVVLQPSLIEDVQFFFENLR